MANRNLHTYRCVLAALLVPALAAAGPPPLQFVFGEQARSQFTLIRPEEPYTILRHYGFLGAAPLAEARSVCADRQPFAFAADVAEGNYDVTLELGGEQRSVTTVIAEARRLLLDRIEVAPGKTETRSFTVNVRYATLEDGEVVRLKADEQGSFDWDHRLTLAFDDAHPCLRSLRIERNDRAPTVYIAGDSTVTDQVREPWAGWGQMLPRFFRRGVAIANYAESGESLKSFVGERRLAKLLEKLRAGDYLFIQFAHNDQKPGSSHVDAFADYQEYLKRYLHEARTRKAVPVLVTSMHRRRFDPDGKIVNTLEGYPEAMRQLARREQVALIDLNAMSQTLFQTLGPEGTLKAFVHYPAGSFPGQMKPLADDTHFTSYGAFELARCVVEGIRQVRLPLAGYLREEVTHFDPSHPDPVPEWRLPTIAEPTVGP